MNVLYCTIYAQKYELCVGFSFNQDWLSLVADGLLL